MKQHKPLPSLASIVLGIGLTTTPPAGASEVIDTTINVAGTE